MTDRRERDTHPDPLTIDVTIDDGPPTLRYDGPATRRPGVELEGSGEWLDVEPDEDGGAA